MLILKINQQNQLKVEPGPFHMKEFVTVFNVAVTFHAQKAKNGFPGL